MTSSLIEEQSRTFDQLVEQGEYGDDFDHAPDAKAFVSAVVTDVLRRRGPTRALSVLDCGCGTGAWLSHLASLLSADGISGVRLCGFDLSVKMVDVARRKLSGLAQPQDLRPGNVLDPSSYDLGGAGYDLIFAYDVIQQLPRREQYGACELMISRLAPNGTALIFDNDRQSPFGRRMGMRKFLTRYCGLKLVPRYYCNAAYPPLERFRQRLSASAWDAHISIRPDHVKRALVIQRRESNAAAPTP